VAGSSVTVGKAHGRTVVALCADDDDNLVSASTDGFVRLWNVAQRSLVCEVSVGTQVLGLCVSDKDAVSFALDGVFRVHRGSSLAVVSQWQTIGTPVTALCLGEGGVYAGCSDGKVFCYSSGALSPVGSSLNDAVKSASATRSGVFAVGSTKLLSWCETRSSRNLSFELGEYPTALANAEKQLVIADGKGLLALSLADSTENPQPVRFCELDGVVSVASNGSLVAAVTENELVLFKETQRVCSMALPTPPLLVALSKSGRIAIADTRRCIRVVESNADGLEEVRNTESRDCYAPSPNVPLCLLHSNLSSSVDRRPNGPLVRV
jgi:hypothetical protein